MGCIGYGYHAVWEVTEACNLRCKHCHATSDKAGPDELTTKEGIFFIDGLSGMKQFQMLVFSGGEPMIRPDIETLLAHSKKRGLVNVIATNGTLIDKSRAKDLKSMGVKGVAISLDSTDPVIHNSIRNNPKSFALAMKGIEACKTAGMVLQINFTAMKNNLSTLEDVVKFCNEVDADIMLCYQLVPIGRGCSISTSALSQEENKELTSKLRSLQRNSTTIIEPVACPQYWPHLLKKDTTEKDKTTLKNHPFHGCAAGWGLLYLKPNGELWPCPFVPISGGNIKSLALEDIYNKSNVFANLKDRNNLKGKCGNCENRYICGGCRGKAFARTADYLAEDPDCYL